jgi:serine/threonine protein kinase
MFQKIDDVAFRIKLIDLGLASELGKRRDCGTPMCLAPEYKSELIPQDLLDRRDVWATGVFLFRLVFVNYPFINNTAIKYQDIKNSISVELDRPGAVRLSRPFHNLIISMLNKNPYERATIAEIKESMFLA